MSSDYTTLAIPEVEKVRDIMPMGYGDRIKELRKSRKLTQSDLATLLNVEQPTIQRWEAGKREPNYENLTTLAAALGVNPSELFSNIETSPLGPTLFVKGAVAAGQWCEAWEHPQDDWHSFTGRSDITGNINHRFGLRVIGDSMNLKYPEGSIVECVSLFGRVEAAPGRRVVVVRQRSDLMYEATVKLLVEQDGELWLRPESTNPAHRAFRLGDAESNIIEIRIIAVVVAATILED